MRGRGYRSEARRRGRSAEGGTADGGGERLYRAEGGVGALADSDSDLRAHSLGGVSSKGPYLVLPNRDTTSVTLMGHCLTWRPNLP